MILILIWCRDIAIFAFFYETMVSFGSQFLECHYCFCLPNGFGECKLNSLQKKLVPDLFKLDQELDFFVRCHQMCSKPSGDRKPKPRVSWSCLNDILTVRTCSKTRQKAWFEIPPQNSPSGCRGLNATLLYGKVALVLIWYIVDLTTSDSGYVSESINLWVWKLFSAPSCRKYRFSNFKQGSILLIEAVLVSGSQT